MLPELRPRLDALERRRDLLLAELGALPPEELAHRSAPGVWTLAEVAQHLMLVERGTARILAARADKPPIPRGRLDPLRRLGMRIILGRIRFKAPMPQILPEPGMTLPEVREEWDRVRASLRTTLAHVTAARLDRPIFKHPLAGVMSVPETLDFLARHHDHHLRQVARLKRARGR